MPWVTNNSPNYCIIDCPIFSVTELSSTGGVMSGGGFAVGPNPYGIAIDVLGNVWVANTGGNTTTELSGTGSILGTFYDGGGLQGYPTTVATDASSNTWITNYGGNSATKMNSTGTATSYSAGGQNEPSGVAIRCFRERLACKFRQQ